MDNDNVIKPDIIQWTPGVREMDTYVQDPTPENLDRVIHYFKKQDGENNLAAKLLSVTLPLFLKLERLIPHRLLGDRARQDPRVLRVALFGFCGETTNRWSAELAGLFGNQSRLREMLLAAVTDTEEIQPVMRWASEGPQLDSYLESPTKENLDRLLYYLTERHQVFLTLFSVSFPHLVVGLQEQVFNISGSHLPVQDVKQVRKCLFVLSAEMSNRWATEYAGLCMNPILIYEGLRSLLEQALPPKS